VALAVDEVLDDAGYRALAHDLLDNVLLLRGCEPLAVESPDREGRCGGGLLDEMQFWEDCLGGCGPPVAEDFNRVWGGRGVELLDDTIGSVADGGGALMRGTLRR
jgi:hypothetical protein